MKFTAALASSLLAAGASASVWQRTHQLVPPIVDGGVIDISSLQRRADGNTTTGAGIFQQLVDHGDPSLGTFDMRFWWNATYYAGPGSPVIFFTPGEIAADNYGHYLTTATIPGRLAQALGGAVVMMEHRYWGTSSPVTELTTKNMQWLTLENSIHDTTYFARNVKLPFDPTGSSSADKAPWVFSGGSYSGALAGWVESKDPGTFWAYHASSAVVEAVGDFWQYFDPVRQGMPQNCSVDVNKVIEHVDKILKSGDAEAKLAIKKKFGLEAIEHDDDFAGVLENGPWNWQSHDFSTGGVPAFFQFCNYVENAGPAFNTTEVPGPEGVGLCKALNGYARWIKEKYLPGACAGYGYWEDKDSLACFDTYNASSPLFTDISLDNSINRQWNWMLCNEPFKYWQNGAPEGYPTLVSRLINNAYWERQCGLFFPEEDGFTYGIGRGLDEHDVNRYTGGWYHTDTTRLMWVNGEWDPWKDATVSSDFRPGGPFEGTETAPLQMVPGGIHCSDLRWPNGDVNPDVRKVQNAVIDQIRTWVEEYYEQKE